MWKATYNSLCEDYEVGAVQTCMKYVYVCENESVSSFYKHFSCQELDI